jgi:hypothetical protein
MKKLFFAVVCALFVASQGAADVRVLHLSPDAPEVDVFLGAADDPTNAVLTNVPFTGVSPYLPVPTGNYFIDVTPSAGGSPVINVDGLAVDGATDYSIAAVNAVASIEPLVLVDDNTIDAGNARIRLVHASPDAPEVDISVDGVGVVSTLSFKENSPYLTLPEGDYTVRILLAGTSTQVFEVPNLQLDAGTVYSAFAAGFVGGSGAQAFTVLPTVDAVPEPIMSPLWMIFVFMGMAKLRR